MKQFLLKSVLFSFIFFGFGIIAFFIIKARSSSSSGLPMDNSSPSTLYVDTNEILTSAKRNKLVDKANRKDMDINDTTTQFDTECERRRKRDNGVLYIPNRVETGTLRRKDNQGARRNVRAINKTRSQLYNLVSTTRSYQSNYMNLAKLQYRCP